MADAYQCNKCGEFGTGDPVVEGYRVGMQMHGEQNKFDLCDQCSVRFEEWLDQPVEDDDGA